MIKILKKLNRLLDRKQKRLMVVIIFCMLIGGVLESLSISGIIPVVTILLEPDVIETNIYLASLYHFLGLTSVNQLMVVMMVALIGAFVLKNLFLFLQNVIQLRFVYTNQFATSRRMMINFMKTR